MLPRLDLRDSRALPTLFALIVSLIVPYAVAFGSESSPGGFVEKATSQAVRPKPTYAEIQAMLPARGLFTFGAPYNTEGIRITNASDCNGGDCVNYVGYSYWRNINNHVNDGSMLIFLGMSKARGGKGPTLFRYDKTTGAVTNEGPLFAATSKYSDSTAEGWYWSASQPTNLYLQDGAKLLRYDVSTKQFQTVFDASSQFGSDKYIWQTQTSDDDRVHSATLRLTSTSESLGCMVYDENTARFSYWAKQGDFDECQVDKSGRWLLILENVDLLFHEDNRIINLQTGEERLLLDQAGAAGHHDLGYGYMVNEDDWAPLPGSAKVWKYDQPLVPGPDQDLLAYHLTSWNVGIGHVSHGNAKPGVPPSQQYVCSSDATRFELPRSDEIVCYRLDTSLDVLVVAPVMTNLDASGGGSDDYSKRPKGNLDVSGKYFIWTSNAGGDRLDAFIVKVPSQLLVPDSGTGTPPSVSITAPQNGATVSGTVQVMASASDDIGVLGVQFKLDGADLGAEDTAAPYSVLWDTTTGCDASHTLTAVARDTSGNTTTSNPVNVTVTNGSPGEVKNLLFSGDKRTLNWSAPDAIGGPSSSVLYDTIRSGNPADFAAGGVCVEADDGPNTAAVDPDTPAPGTVYYYLVRAQNGCGQGSLGKNSQGVERAGRDCAPTGPTVEPVVWINAVNVSVTGGSIRKVSGVDGVDDAGATSQQEISSGDGYVQFTAAETAPLRYAGLSHGSANTSAGEIDFAVRFQGGNAEVRENGVYRSDTPFVTGDVFRVSVEAGRVKYYKNGTPFYTSLVTPVYPLIVDSSLVVLNCTIQDAVISLTASAGASAEDRGRQARSSRPPRLAPSPRPLPGDALRSGTKP